jgi:hypothetical protein
MAAKSHAVPQGDHLLYVESSRLLAQRLHQQMPVGEPVAIRENILHDPGTRRSIVSVSKTGLLAYHAAGAVLGSHLTWISREGKVLSEMPPRPMSDVAISPDGEKVAMIVGDPKGVVVIHDIARGVETRLSFVEGSCFAPVWTPDGRHVVFSSVSAGGHQMFIKPADGSEPERLLIESPFEIRPTDVSPDGTLVLYHGRSDKTVAIMALPLAGGPPRVVVDTPGDDVDGRISPDGRWITYTVSDRGGRAAFVAPFPGLGAKWQISNDVVYGSWWNPSGGEIFYLTDQMFAVGVSFVGNSVRFASPQPLFPVSVDTNNFPISVTPDGQRFLVVSQPRGSGVATLVTNWDSDLR